MRLFLGFPVPQETSTLLQAWQQEVQHPSVGFRWVPSDNWHLTVLFIGEIKETDWPTLQATLQPSFAAFSLAFQRFRVIKRKGTASMVWAQYEPDTRLNELYQQLHQQIGKWVTLPPVQAKVTPHLTLARIKTKSRVYPIEWPEWSLPPLPCEKLVLYRSHLTPQGAQYETLTTFLPNS